MRLGSMTGVEWEGVTSSAVLLPVGSTENHGPHLPLETDRAIAEAVCVAAAEHDERLVVAPPVAYGVSYQHRGMPGGAVSVPPALLVEVVASIVAELLRTERRVAVMVVNGHSGNTSAVTGAVDELGRRLGQARVAACSWWNLVMDVIEEQGRADAGGVGHAGAIETSLMLAISPELVRRDRIPDGAQGWPDSMLRDRRIHRWLAFDPSIDDGVLGSPRDADDEFGRKLLEAAGGRVADLALRLLAGD
jgi:creatinine amidohydrolase